MQASKIKPDFCYAIRQDDKLVRFHVTAVNTKRIHSTGSPHDYESTVEGHVDIRDGEKGKAITRTLKPDAILGLFEEHAELIAREAAEKAARKAEDEANKALTLRLWKALHRIAGIEEPELKENPRSFAPHADTPIRLGYNATSIDIRFDGVEPLLKALQRAEAMGAPWVKQSA